MKPKFDQQRNVRAWCDRCSSVTTFERSGASKSFGAHGPEAATGGGTQMYRLYRCSGCHRGGMGELRGLLADEIHMELVSFYPSSFARAPLPADTPDGVRNEIDEAAQCADAGAFRGASALLRSGLEKTLKANGYTNGNLKGKIDQAADDAVITSARRQRAHSNVRDLGNDIVHEDWRPVDAAEFESAYLYVQRIVEDFYDHRSEVLDTLKAAGRLDNGEATPGGGEADA